MHSTLERKVFRYGIKPSRRTLERSTLKRALVSGVSVAVTMAMLGVSGQAMAAIVNYKAATADADWGNTAAHFTPTTAFNVANTNNLDLNGQNVVIDETGDEIGVGEITATGGGSLVIETSGASTATDISSTIGSISMDGVTANIDIKAHEAQNASVTVNVQGILKTGGYLNLTSDETSVDAGNSGDITVTVDGDLKVGSSTITGSGAAGVSADVKLDLKSGTNEITNGLTLDAKTPGTAGKAILAFIGNTDQNFTGTIKGKEVFTKSSNSKIYGDGIIEIAAADATSSKLVTFKDEIGGGGKPLYKIALNNHTKGARATFEQSVAVLGTLSDESGPTGIHLGDSTGGNGSGGRDEYTATFDAYRAAGNLLTINASIMGVNKDDDSIVIIQGSEKTVEQSADRPWGYTDSPNATDKANVQITNLYTKKDVTFISNSTISAKNITIESDSTANFAVTGYTTENLTLQNNSTIILSGTANDGTKKGSADTNQVFQNNGGAVAVTAGTVVIDVGTTGLLLGDYIILVDSGSSVDSTDISKISVSDGDADIDFEPNKTDDANQIRLVAVSVGEGSAPPVTNPTLPTIAGIPQISDRMLNHAAAAIAARTGARFSRDAKYARTGFRATDFYQSRGADDRSFREAGDRGFERTDDRSFREGGERGFQKMDDRRLREGDERDFGKTDDRRLREADERKFQKTHERELREADERKLEKEHERKLDEKRHEHGDGEVHKPGERAIQKPVERPTGVSSGDSVGRAENAWFETFGDWIEQDAKRSSDNAYDVDGYNADIYGFAFGVDTEVARDTLLGISFSYSNADVDWEGTSNAAGDVDHYQLTLYGEYRHDKFYAEGMLGYAMNDYEVSDFNGGVRNSEFDSDQYLAKLELGVPIYMGNNLFITPKSELTWAHLDIDNYTQTGTGSNLLTVNPNDLESATATLGAEIHQRIKKNKGYIIPWAYAGVSYDLAGEEASVRAAVVNTSSYYSLQGIDNEQFAGEVEFGVEYEVGQWSVGAKYAGRYKASRDTHSASLLAEYKF
uniref:Autotransporter beta-domain-containing protein n=1 Tax=Candidatus Kentrum sp. LPFa TaxID=2126335 RepID=A0A450VSM3_9GAMM|nr:MAG: Autotransporter beta-domain-containing protein [Candidatus Kentron sp. LPFa]VFK29728.1 MAG: Autotransporter beta-domain-containing protein [Candidatus Kentron sp. LPFa]